KGEDNRPVLWGSGFMRAGAEGADHTELEALAVRGTRTAARVTPRDGQEPALGEPGLLAPLFLDGPVRKRYALGVIPHYKDAVSPFAAAGRTHGQDGRIMDVGWMPQVVGREIAACDAMISSSLHGLIFADALGVPNLVMRLGGKIGGGLYKFRDY